MVAGTAIVRGCQGGGVLCWRSAQVAVGKLQFLGVRLLTCKGRAQGLLLTCSSWGQVDGHQRGGVPPEVMDGWSLLMASSVKEGCRACP